MHKPTQIFRYSLITGIALILTGMTACTDISDTPDNTVSIPKSAVTTQATTDIAPVITESESITEPVIDNSTEPAELVTTYRSEIEVNAVTVSNTFHSLDVLLIDPQPDNEEWINEVTVELNSILALCKQAGEITPPDSLLTEHLAYLETITDMSEATGLLIGGINEGNPDIIRQASAEMWITTEVLLRFTG